MAQKIGVSSKAVSKWETGQGFPDISLIEPLSRALNISVIELLSGADISNKNESADIRKVRFYVCPVCGNIISAIGDAVVSCCGITLLPSEIETEDKEHIIHCEIVEDEYFVTVNHPCEKDHYISFLAAVSDNRVQFIKLYPEGNAEARFKISGVKRIYAYCNRHGLFSLEI